ncbi:SOS response-associated peptidase [Alicyclobacillus cycloheptanicus]|uniref:Abasic site processing protein n=1 Tax=Alicyclobacillus cycloheptanicus TaxID=1457 RepID=A0ABT9XD75_9BACL|nr:SOS response-associated peptidase [Alicyclobacillus cycloheptanicus]MDQ0188249.1 putative SOS response-associated peptidase YedK [Alicyclobacillus cycloheptanicus]WDM00973.1 SOS response-associated peptidase [Alicyclobacillus cycloheptanicus]
MCGRFTLTEDWSSILRYYGITDSNYAVPPRYNIAPSQRLTAVISDGTKRRIGPLTWGLVPKVWSHRDPHHRPINVRVEGITVNMAFRKLLERKRCLIPADGYYEWHRNTKQPYRIRLRSRNIFSFAGIWDTYETETGERVSTCAFVTCEPNMKMKVIHDRMPVILRDFQHERFWLDRHVTDVNQLLTVLKPYPDDDMYAYPVSKAVGNARNDNAELIREVH